MSDVVEVQVPCPSCGGYGYEVVSQSMASDAGDETMTGARWTCSTCNGGGFILEQRMNADKPASTEHGTGSGEARQDYIRCCFATPRRYRINGNVIVCDNCGREVELPTPPASPTVTLDRAVYDMVTTALTSLEGLLELNNACNAAHQVRDLLALLRAAEGQK